MVTISDIQTSGDFFRRSDEAGTANITAAKKLEAAALALEDIQNQALFRFTQRVQRFNYLDSHSDYVISDNATNYEASVRAPDFRAPKDLRLSLEHIDDFDYMSPNEFALAFGQSKTNKIYTVEERDGAKVLRVNQADIGSKTTLHLANAYDANGTWAVDATNSDAINIATDTVVYVKNSGAIRFDTDVSQSANNKVTISIADMTAVDISAYEKTGIIRFWLYTPEVTDDSSIYVDSVELRWGSSAATYWSQTVARPANGRIFTDRWNLLEFNWRDATQTGTVDETAINFLLVTVNYNASQPDDIGFRINDIRIYNPKEMKLVYFSNFTVKSPTGIGIWMPRAVNTNNQILIPDRYKNCVVFAYNYYLLSMERTTDDPDVKHWLEKYKGKYDIRTRKWVGGELQILIREQGERVKLPQRKLVPQTSFD